MQEQQDMWYLSAEVTIGGEVRGFSRQIRARMPRHGVMVPAQVETVCREFLADVITGTDVFAYDAVKSGEHTDWPYRFCSYHLQRNGETVIRSVAVRPVKPEVLTA